MPTITRDGVALAYEEAGFGAPPLLLVHGAFCDRTDVAALAARYRDTHRVVSVDLRGHGGSDAPQQDYTVPAFADDLAWMCAQLGLHRPVVIGHSLGGMIALQLAADHPELPAAVVALDATLCPPPGTGEMLAPFTAAVRTAEYAAAVQQFMAMTLLPTDTVSHGAGLIERIARVPQHVIVSVWEQALLGWDATPAAQACAVPLLYLDHGAPNADLARLGQLCPTLQVGRTVGAGHWALLEVPEQVTVMIDRFLVTSLAVSDVR